MKWIKSCSRRLSDKDIEIWKKGDKLLKNWIGIDITCKFEREGEWINIYYEKEEGDKVYDVIKEFLKDDGNFDKLCEDFFEVIDKINKLKAEMMPALNIFDEIDNYPEIASDYVKRRLMRVRTSTHEESYK